MWCINHLEWCVGDLEATEKQLCSVFGYRPIAERRSQLSIQRFLALGETRILLTQRTAGPGDNRGHQQYAKLQGGGYPSLFCCKGDHIRDAVFNVAISVSNFAELLERLRPSGKILMTSEEEEESLNYVILSAPCENVCHIIMDQKYSGVLPGFSSIKSEDKRISRSENILQPYFDHVTFVVPRGHSLGVLDWYSQFLGMRRFLVQPGELPDVGVEIKDHVGLRLMVGEWLTSWSCREEGVRAPGSSVMLVLAEPLEDNSDSHVQKFLDHNGGSGVQHLGLAVKKGIASAVQEMIQNGCTFQRPPPTYYQLPSKILEIQSSGEDMDTFSRLGLLIDAEADGEESCSLNAVEKYLIQIFTKPLFKEDTFFMEVLERRGARGFGSGNIMALAESIILYNKTVEGG